MTFDHDLLQEIKKHADIVDVISSYVNVIKKGRNYASICPFHDDHNPSMNINKERQTYHCFVCHAGGDVFSFVSEYEKIPFSEAVKRVCEITNFDDPRLHQLSVSKPVNPDIQVLYNCINELQKFYEYGLQTDEGKIAKDYLAKRQISEQQASKFSLGYAIKDGKKTISYLQQKGFSLKNIEDIGIALAKASDTADSNAGRLIFPIKNYNGQVVGFSARKFDENKETPKYVNSPETKIFRKSDILYNFDLAKQTAKRDGYIYLVEGFMDVFALDSIGISSAVALMGTKLSQKHLELLRRLNVEIRLCLDGDKPGQEAMMAMMLQLDKAEISYRLVSIPKEIRDPDEILKQDGKDKLIKFVNSLVDPFDFALNYYQNISPLNTIDDRKKVIAHFAPMINGLKSKLEYEDYIYKLADVTGFNHNAIRDYLKDVKGKTTETSSSNYIFEEKPPHTLKLARELRRLTNAEKIVLEQMAQSKVAIDFYEKNIKYFTTEIYRQLANYFVEYASKYSNIELSMVIDLIASSNPSNKKELLALVSSLPNRKVDNGELTEILNDCLKVIEEERNVAYEKSLLKKALEGKSQQERARLLDDYVKRTNKDNKPTS